MGDQPSHNGARYKPLSMKDVSAIHDTVLRVFSEVGFQVNLSEGRDLFKKAGAEVDESTATVKLSPDLVMELIKRAPDTVTLCGRDPNGKFDCEISGTKVFTGTGGTALNVQEPGETERRPSRLDDIVNMARLVDRLNNIHVYMLNVYPHELPESRVDVNRFAAGLNHTLKHVMGGVYTVEGVRNVVKMAEIIAGSPEKLRERPIVSMVTCVISPFKLDAKYSRLAVEAARSGVPVVVPSEPLSGATAPVTLAANLVVWAVDTLAGVMLTQLVRAGTPVLAGCVASITDMRDLKYLSGAVEMGLLNAGAAQLAQFYGLPIYTTAGMSDSKVNDAQAGYESAMTNVMVALAGGNFIHDAAGFLEFCTTASYDKLVIDNEILGMALRAVEGIRVSEKTLAFDVLKEAGPGGHFVSNRHTRKFMRSELYTPTLSDREKRDQWTEDGAEDAWTRATIKAKEILDAPARSVLPSDEIGRIAAEIPGIDPSVFHLH
jgi:trimethylamine:corrinoid methyltransferase-like protein